MAELLNLSGSFKVTFCVYLGILLFRTVVHYFQYSMSYVTLILSTAVSVFEVCSQNPNKIQNESCRARGSEHSHF